MATVRYTSHFKGAAGNEFLVRIYDLEYTHSPLGWGFLGSVPMTIQGDGLEINYKGKTDTHLDPIIPSTCDLKLLITNDDQEKLITNIEAGSEFQLALEILHKTQATAAGEWDPYWRGVLAPETVSTDLGIHPFGVSLTFTDGLSLLKDVPFRVSEHVPYEGAAKLRKHIGRALSQLPHYDLWDYTNAGDPFFVSLSDLYHKNHVVGTVSGSAVYTDDPLFYGGADSGAFYAPRHRENPYGRHFIEEGAYFSCYDVIRDIMVAMGLRMNHAYGRFFAVSPTVMASTAASTQYLLHGRKSDARSMLNASFQDSVSSQLSQTDHTHRIGKEEFSSRYDIAVGSQESWLPAVHSATYVHEDAGVKGVFPKKDAYYLDLECWPAPPMSQVRPINPFLGFNSGVTNAKFPSGGIVNSDATCPEDTGLRIKGKLKIKLRNPRNGESNDVGTGHGQVRVEEQWLGCKIVCDLRIKVGNQYLVQTITQTTSSDFTDEATFGEITLNSSAPGVQGGSERQYYPLEASTADWDTVAGDFSFDCANFELTNPMVQGIEYDDENGEVTSYPVGCWTRRREHNNLRYDNESYNHWTSDQASTLIVLNPFTADGEDVISFSHPNPTMTIDLDLQTPPLPEGIGEQTGVTIDATLRGFTAEGDALPDDAPADVSTGDDWLGNVLAGPAYIKDFEVFIGSGEEDTDTFYRVSEATPKGGEHFLAGSSILGSRYAAANGAVGYLTHSNSDTPPAEGFGLGYKMITEGTTETTRGNYEELAASAYQFRSKNRHMYNLRLIRKQGSPNYLIAPHTLFHYSYANPDEDLLVLESKHNLHREEIEVTAIELSTEPRTVTEVSNADDRGESAGFGGGGYPTDVLGGKLAATVTGGVPPAEVSKLGFLNTNSAGDGIDTIDGFTGGGGSVSAEDQLKLDAITIDASGNITDFTVAGEPLTSDEIEDAGSSHKFATSGQLTQISTNQSAINSNSSNIATISNGLTDIQSFLKSENTGDGVGVYVDTEDITKSHVSVTETAAKLQVGQRTEIDMSETSPGFIALNVQAGATGNEAQVTAIQISGSSTVNNKATVNVIGGDFRVSSPAQFSQDVGFAGSSNTITFTAGTSGIDYNDLNNLPQGAPQAVNYARMSMSTAVLRGGASQQDYNGTSDVIVKFDTEDDNDGGGITTNTTTHRMTVADAGLYRLTVNMSFFSSSARSTPSVRFNVNGSTIPGDSNGYIRAATGQNESTANYTRVIALNANDYIDVCCHDDSTATGSIYAEVGIFEVEKLGGVIGPTGATGPAGADGADGAPGADGLGFTGGSYNASTGVVTFTSDDGLGFSTSDLRGADGADGADGAPGADGADGSDANALGGADQSIAAGVTRNITLNGSGGSVSFLRIRDGQGNTLEDIQSYGNGVAIQEKYGSLSLRSTATLPGSLSIFEPTASGQNYLQFRAPALASNTIYTFPNGYGTNGQVLTTNGTGTLSWTTASGGAPPQTYTFHDAGRRQFSSSQDNYYHVGDFTYGLSDNNKNGTLSSYTTGSLVSNLIDDFHINSFVVPANCTSAAIRGSLHTNSSALVENDIDVYVYKLVPNSTTNAYRHTATEVLNVTVTMPENTRRVIAFNVDASNLSLSAGDYLHVVYKPNGVVTGSTHYLFYSHTLTITE